MGCWAAVETLKLLVQAEPLPALLLFDGLAAAPVSTFRIRKRKQCVCSTGAVRRALRFTLCSLDEARWVSLRCHILFLNRIVHRSTSVVDSTLVPVDLRRCRTNTSKARNAARVERILLQVPPPLPGTCRAPPLEPEHRILRAALRDQPLLDVRGGSRLALPDSPGIVW